MTDASEATSTTPYPGFRRAHAKGICVVGHFDGTPEGAALSRARVFADTGTPVLGRMSIGGGSPYGLDAQARVRSMALVLNGADGSEWRMAMNSFPFFGAASIETFLEQTRASAPDPATGKPDPERMAAFAAQHPEAQRFAAWAKSAPWSDSFANTQYHSINAFRLIDAAGAAHPVRWQLEPQTAFAALPAQVDDKQFLQHDLQQRLAQGPLRWTLRLVLAEPGDAVDDPARPWPAERRSVDAGTLVLEQVDAPEQGACRDLNFDPLILPRGIEASADPILAARSAAYSESFNRRSRESLSTGAKP